ncbi:MAG: hypothetical protein ACK4MG_10210 [Aquabacterium sp.]|uniref:hypothetical protein n=1 Tax=uncultured Aquabacterium sp. TaxID=158753 RepID=UPI0025E2E55D|nr:hypothetical protein [uncultured Aquabacterium sp.]
MFKKYCLAAVMGAALLATGCTTMTTNNIQEVQAEQVKGCKKLGAVNGSDAIFVGLSASIGSKNAKAKAMNAAVDQGASHVVWSQMGTSMTNEWIGTAYRCK